MSLLSLPAEGTFVPMTRCSQVQSPIPKKGLRHHSMSLFIVFHIFGHRRSDLKGFFDRIVVAITKLPFTTYVFSCFLGLGGNGPKMKGLGSSHLLCVQGGLSGPQFKQGKNRMEEGCGQEGWGSIREVTEGQGAFWKLQKMLPVKNETREGCVV